MHLSVVGLLIPAWAHSNKATAAGLLLWAGWQEISIDRWKVCSSCHQHTLLYM